METPLFREFRALIAARPPGQPVNNAVDMYLLSGSQPVVIYDQFIERAEMVGGDQQRAARDLKDNPRRLGKDRARLVGTVPLKPTSKGFGGGGSIHQFLWRRSRAVSNAK